MKKYLLFIVAVVSMPIVSYSQNTEADLLLMDKILHYVDSLEKNDPVYQKAEMYNEQGLIENKKGNYDLAISYFTKAIETRPLPAVYLYTNRIESYILKGDFIKAVSEYNFVIEKYPYEDGFVTERGKMKMKLKDFRGAILDFNKAIDIKKKSKSGDLSKFAVDAKIHKALCLNNMNKYSEALLLANEVVKTCVDEIAVDKKINLGTEMEYKETLPFAYYIKGDIQFNLKKIDDACICWSKAGELGFSEAYNSIKEHCNK